MGDFMKFTEIDIANVKNMIGEKRYDHIERVVQTVVELSKIYEVDVERAKTAALLHDVGKIKSKELYMEYIEKYNIKLDSYELENPDLAHGKLSAKIAYFEFGIKDDLILEAIRMHTTGNAEMHLITKLVFIADYIEPKRNHESCVVARKLAFEGKLDESLLYAMNQTIKYVIDRDEILHVNTIKARNSLIISRRYSC